MADTSFDDKIRQLSAERDFIVKIYQTTGSPVTIRTIKDRLPFIVKKEDGNKWTPSWDTVHRDMQLFQDAGFIESTTMPKGQILFKPKEAKLRIFKNLKVEKLIKDRKPKE